MDSAEDVVGGEVRASPDLPPADSVAGSDAPTALDAGDASEPLAPDAADVDATEITGELPPPDGASPESCDPAMESVQEVPLGGVGLSDEVAIPVPPGTGQVIVRVSPVGPLGRDVCWQLHGVHAGESEWVPEPEGASEYGLYCTDCVHRVSLGRGYGLFSFPNDGDPLGPVEMLRFRVSAWECETRLPAWVVEGTDLELSLPDTVQLEITLRAAPEPLPEAQLHLHLVVSGALRVDTTAAVQAAEALLAPAGIRLSIEAQSSTSVGGVAFQPSAHAEIDALMPTDSQPRRVPVMLVPCLTETNSALGLSTPLSGYTTRIPGGYPACGLADAVVVAVDCAGSQPLSAAELGVILAHELGHFLGLYHVTESDGTPDHMDDTDGANLMSSAPLAASPWPLSARQVDVMRRHPYLLYPEAAPD